MQGFTHNLEGPHAHRNHGHRLGLAAQAFNHNHITVFNALFVGELVAHLNVLLWFCLKQGRSIARF